jgi:hypothetical protein
MILSLHLKIQAAFENKKKLFEFFISWFCSAATRFDQQFVLDKSSPVFGSCQYLSFNTFEVWQLVFNSVCARKNHVLAWFVNASATRGDICITDYKHFTLHIGSSSFDFRFV